MVADEAGLTEDFFNADFPGVKPTVALRLELAGEENMVFFQATLRPGVDVVVVVEAAVDDVVAVVGPPFFRAEEEDEAAGRMTEGLFIGEGL